METVQIVRCQPFISVVIPARNEEKWIAACLESVLKDNYPHKEVIVVDDGSTDRTSEILKRFPVTVVRNEKPAGPSSARNIGVKEARGEIVVFIDAHCIVDDEQWIEKFLRFFRDPEVGAVAGYFKWKPSRIGASLTFKVSTQQRLIKSANAAYRKAIFEQLGGFDPSLEWAGDAALTYKMRRSGWKIVHSRDIEVVHAEKLWSIKRAFLYGTCFFPLRKRYPRETSIVIDRKFPSSSMGMGLLLILGFLADVFCGFPVFTLSLTAFFSVLMRGTDLNVSIGQRLKDGFYTTIWSYTYFLGALFGGIRNTLLRMRLETPVSVCSVEEPILPQEDRLLKTCDKSETSE